MLRRPLVILITTVVLLAGCGSSDDDPSADAATSSTEAVDPEAGGSGANRNFSTEECGEGMERPTISVSPVEGTSNDLELTSLDGTRIRVHWFPVDDGPAPTILMGPGWARPGDTSEEATPGSGVLGIGAMNERGYNVITWDPRGFGESEGTVELNDSISEGRDVQAILNWLAKLPEALTETIGDPVVGMVGAGYGGGIQMVAAGSDCRVDVIVPDLGYYSLDASFYPNETFKVGWADALIAEAEAEGAEIDPGLTGAAASAEETGTLSEEERQWFLERGPTDLVDSIRVPALLLHGTVDTLFPLQQAVTAFETIQRNEAPISMLWYCGGHGTCLTEPGDLDLTEATVAWLDRYLMGDESVETGPVVSVIDQDGRRWTGDDYPSEPDATIAAEGEGGELALTEESVAGPLADNPSTDPLAEAAGPLTPTPADTALELAVPVDAEALVLGAPHLTMTYSGSTPDGPEPTRVFAQLVDPETGLVVGNQITPIPIELDGEEHTAEIDLEVVAQHVEAGDELVLQVVATTPAYVTPRLGGEITVTALEVELPTTEALTLSE